MTELFVLAVVGNQQIAFDATRVEAVVDIALVVPVPLSPAYVLGLAAIRSQVVTVIDCSAIVASPPVAPTGRAIISAVDGHRYALRVDRVDDVVSGAVGLADTRVPLDGRWAEISDGVVEVGGAFAVVIDPARLIAAETPPIAA